ncbi:asparaginase [Pusillimonas sp. DMV24BSW_D]|uniref:asparaginase n=1 Tax=Neopusillimonas aestuarii TaxID=2716226 RepID=UPI0014091688|nr:asparaginase [Pusillimonas sp. DMV24BSW_D]QIM48127.1 asparaginase [Pusillimonas sp. DMV24BSW_D]
MTLPTVHVYVLGGTITMAGGAGTGIVPKLSGEDLMAQVPGLRDVANVVVKTPFLKPGASLTFAELTNVAAMIQDDPAQGHVVVQGTDTIDETAFFLGLLHNAQAPVVVTGAMRGASALSADGPANLLAAIHTAGHPEAADRGALVVLNDEIHQALHVEKMHKGLVQAFQSVNGGAVGYYFEGRPRFLHPAPQHRAVLFSNRVAPERVAVVKAVLDGDDALLRATLDLGYHGVVVEAMGAGHLPAQYLDALDTLLERIPVVLASRVPAGPVFQNTYGFPGSEIDLIRRGVIPAGWLSPHKARILLAAALGAGQNVQEVRATFARFA